MPVNIWERFEYKLTKETYNLLNDEKTKLLERLMQNYGTERTEKKITEEEFFEQLPFKKDLERIFLIAKILHGVPKRESKRKKDVMPAVLACEIMSRIIKNELNNPGNASIIEQTSLDDVYRNIKVLSEDGGHRSSQKYGPWYNRKKYETGEGELTPAEKADLNKKAKILENVIVMPEQDFENKYMLSNNTYGVFMNMLNWLGFVGPSKADRSIAQEMLSVKKEHEKYVVSWIKGEIRRRHELKIYTVEPEVPKMQGPVIVNQQIPAVPEAVPQDKKVVEEAIQEEPLVPSGQEKPLQLKVEEPQIVASQHIPEEVNAPEVVPQGAELVGEEKQEEPLEPSA